MFHDPWLPREWSFRHLSPPNTHKVIQVSHFIRPLCTWDIQRLSDFLPQKDINLILTISFTCRNLLDDVAF